MYHGNWPEGPFVRVAQRLEHRIHNPEVESSSLSSDIHFISITTSRGLTYQRSIILLIELLLTNFLTPARRKHCHGIHGGSTRSANFEMKMGASAAAGAPHQGNTGTLRNQLTFFHQKSAVMGITG